MIDYFVWICLLTVQTKKLTRHKKIVLSQVKLLEKRVAASQLTVRGGAINLS